MRREVVLSAPALADLLDINDYYLCEVSDRVANGIIDGLEAAVNNLAEFPDRGSIPKELLALGIRQYRQIIENPYRIIYEILTDQIVYFKRASFRLFQKTIGTSWSLKFAC